MINTYSKNGDVIIYEVKYKQIKHVYFKDLGDMIQISCNPKMKTNELLRIIDHNFDKIIKLKSKRKKLKTEKYQLWGKVLSEKEFFETLIPSDKHLIKKYISETEKQIKILEPKLSSALKILNLDLVPTKVKKLKSKYGSCQIIKKEITINAFLAKLDPSYLYYVLIHEYCHLNVANHSSAFYNELSKVLINHKEIQKNLRKHVITF